jgi:hypothetical protein
MIIIFDKKAKKLVGLATQVSDNGEWREPTLEELYPDRDCEELDCVYVKDSLKYALKPDPDLWELELDENGTPIGVKQKQRLPKLYLSTTAVDTDGDGLPELIADGEDTATITIEVKNSQGERVQADFPLTLKTTGGRLSARRIVAQGGQATVELTASVETVSVTVSVSGEGVQDSSISLEFMPPEA